TRLSTLAEHGRLVVMFGGLPIRNAQVSGGGVGKHRLRGVLEDAADAGVRFVNLSPLRTDAATSLNAEWLPPRPGSDTALMMALAHTLLSEGLHDRAFLDRYTIGFDRLADYLNGADGIVKDAEWAADICGLPADRIRTLARDMAAGPTLITTAVSLQRADWGEQPLWMTVALAAMLGQIGLPGAGYGIGYAADSSIGTMDRAAPWSAFPQGSNPVADFIPVAMISDMLLNPGGRYDFNGAERTFPDIRMVWWAGGNPFHHHQDLGTLAQAFQRPETVIVNEFNWTATARHADIVLPVAAPQERTDFGAGTQDNALVPMPKFAEPPGEARIEFEIFRDLEARLDLADGFSKGRTAEEWIDRLWDDMRRKIPELPDFEAFLNGGPMEFDDPDPEHVFLSRFRQDPEAHRLPTPSGRIELFSETIAGFGYADCPGHPVWRAPRDWSVRDRYPLHLVSGQPGTRLHSQLDNGSYSRSRKVKDREPVLLHPEDAAARGIADGDIVEMFNDRGRCLAGAVVTDDVLKGTVFLWTGAWYDPDENGLCRHGNPNVLTHDLRTSALSQGPAAQSALVEVKVAVDPPPVLAFEPPIFGNLP
ncbi:MAG: molybdopterin-dependent oxidoreductase, partial [Pseudomonadota bacterium]